MNNFREDIVEKNCYKCKYRYTRSCDDYIEGRCRKTDNLYIDNIFTSVCDDWESY